MEIINKMIFKKNNDVKNEKMDYIVDNNDVNNTNNNFT
jgi:hypothetical protein